MKILNKAISILLFFILFCVFKLVAQSANALEFIENKGQWEKQVRFKGDLINGAFFLRNTGFTVVQHSAADLSNIADRVHGHKPKENTPVFANSSNSSASNPKSPEPDVLHSHAYNMDFVGANQNAEIVPDKVQPGYNNYFLGNDSTKWMGNCRLFQTITYKNLYPGIDVKYYSDAGNLKYEFIVHPGSDPSQIVMKFEGLDKISVKNNELILKTSVGEVKELYPYTYQFDGTAQKKIDCKYVLTGNTVRFAVKNFSNKSTLIIDPTLIFASFTGSTADNWGYTATYGADGTFYAGGIVFQTGFPVSPGAFQRTYSAAGVNEQTYWNMGIMKFSADGSQRLFATYIGGNSKDQPHSLFADAQGNLVIAGRTTSSNYPTTANFGTQGGWDIVVTKINSAGSALIGSVRVGGSADDGFNTADSHNVGPTELLNNYGDDARSEVILDGGNNIYVTSCTMSNNFFTTPNAVQRTFGGEQDAVLIKVNPDCNAVTYSTYLGGSKFDAGFVLALNPTTRDIYVAGGTNSTNFPGNKAGSYQQNYNGGNNSRSDGFIAVFSNDGTVFKQSTYMGTTGTDVVFGIQFDKFSFPYIMGITTGDWPVLNAAYSNPGSRQYISKLKKDLSGFEYSTVFGTGSRNPNISPVAFLVDRCENVYVSGWGKDIIGKYNLDPIANMPITPDALKKQPDESDFYFIVIQRNASKLLYGTFYGQSGGLGEHVDGGTSRFDQNGVIYQAICANCGGGQGNTKPRWPITPGAWCCSSGYAAANVGGQCNLAALKISFNFAGVGAGVRAYINSVFDTTGCVPLTVKIRDTILNAKSYEWNFGDGSPVVATDSAEVSHTYNNVGRYRVQMVAVDSTSCNIRDTAYITMIVRNDQAVLNFNPVKLPPCESLNYRFDNLSTYPPAKPFTSLIWDFGDGTRTTSSGTASVNHTYKAVGTYKVRLILLDTLYCNGPDSLEKELRISPQVKAEFETPPLGCVPYTAKFKNISLAGQSFRWDFGDGTTDTSINPSHVYTNPGSYVVKLVALDPSTCNFIDSTASTISIQGAPTAAFSVTPVVPVENTPFTFTNTSSQNANRFKWFFGDDDSLITTSRSPIDHQYRSTNTFNACLIALNQAGCADTVCAPVTTIVVPRIDIPNAFTPLGPTETNRIFVRGFAIAKMNFSIYNRLGQKVFESNDVNLGWDGKFNGVVQPMDVYGYTLNIEFSDGTKKTQTGDITLIR